MLDSYCLTCIVRLLRSQFRGRWTEKSEHHRQDTYQPLQFDTAREIHLLYLARLFCQPVRVSTEPLHQYIVVLCLTVRKNTTYRTILDELIQMTRIRSARELEELPSPSTLCKVFNRLDWRLGVSCTTSLSHLSRLTVSLGSTSPDMTIVMPQNTTRNEQHCRFSC